MALALMRRHRRWLYIFLWLVIAAFIILYIPTLQDSGQGTPGEAVVKVGGLPVSVGEFQRTYRRQRQMYDRLYQGRLDENMLRQMGLEEQVLEGLVSDRLVELESRRLGVTVSDEALARAIATSPEFQDDGRFIGTDEIRRRLELQGLSEEDFEHSLRRQLLRESLESLVGASVSVSEAEVEREFRRRTEQVKLEYVLADAARYRAAVQPTEEEVEGPLRGEEGRLPDSREARRLLRPARPRHAPAAGGGDRPRHRAVLPGPPGGVPSGGGGLREPHPGQGEGGRRRRGTPRRRGAEDRAGAPRPGEGRGRLRRPREEVLRGPGLRPERRRPGLLRSGTHGARVRRRGLRPRSPARSPSSSRPPSATTSSASPRSARPRSSRWPR